VRILAKGNNLIGDAKKKKLLLSSAKASERTISKADFISQVLQFSSVMSFIYRRSGLSKIAAQRVST
jgi:hypothetical protein